MTISTQPTLHPALVAALDCLRDSDGSISVAPGAHESISFALLSSETPEGLAEGIQLLIQLATDLLDGGAEEAGDVILDIAIELIRAMDAETDLEKMAEVFDQFAGRRTAKAAPTVDDQKAKPETLAMIQNARRVIR